MSIHNDFPTYQQTDKIWQTKSTQIYGTKLINKNIGKKKTLKLMQIIGEILLRDQVEKEQIY